jgi:hypothetical protein
MRNHRVALINADVLAVKPVEYVWVCVRSCLQPSLYLEMIDWVKASKIEYLGHIKPALGQTMHSEEKV